MILNKILSIDGNKFNKSNWDVGKVRRIEFMFKNTP